MSASGKISAYLWLALLPVLFSCSGKFETKELNGQNYSLSYNEDWYLDTYDEDFDPDYYFLISSRDQTAFVSVFLYEGHVDEARLLHDKAEKHMSQTIEPDERKQIRHWGNYDGAGLVLNGRLMGSEQAELTLFAHGGKRNSFLIVSQVMNGDREKYKATMEGIANSFRLKED